MLPLDIFFVRHCESEGNIALGKFHKCQHSSFALEFLNRHNSHFRLTDKGRKQCPVVGAWLKEWLKEKKLPHFDCHFVSTHARTLETAALLDLPDAAWEMDFQLHERNNGLWGIIPDKKWQERHASFRRLQRNHHFYTPMPDGESIADACNRLRNFICALESGGLNRKRVIIVTHGDVIRAFRVIFEGISPDRYHELIQENQCDFRIGNGQIVQYSRVDPAEPMCSKDEFRWVRSINPWSPKYAGHDWQKIEQRRYSNDELLALADRYPRLVND